MPHHLTNSNPEGVKNPTTGARRRRGRRKLKGAAAVVAGCTLALAAAGQRRTYADAAASASATAVGVQSTGLLTLPPTPVIIAEQPPDSGERREVVLDVGAPPMAVSATAVVVAEASRDSRVATAGFPELMDNALRRHVPEAATNARAFTRVQGLGVVLETSQDAVQGELAATLVGARAVETSAIARCVSGEALFDTDFNIVGLTVLGQDLGLEALLAPILAGLRLEGLVSVKQGEAGPLPGGGVFINGLHIEIPLLDVDVVVGRSEARMPTPCGLVSQEAGGTGGTGGAAAAGAPTASPLARLAPRTGPPLPATGGPSANFPYGVGALVLGLALRTVNRRWRRSGASTARNDDSLTAGEPE